MCYVPLYVELLGSTTPFFKPGTKTQRFQTRSTPLMHRPIV